MEGQEESEQSERVVGTMATRYVWSALRATSNAHSRLSLLPGQTSPA